MEGFEVELDPGIRDAVILLRSKGIETFESCEGGPGHAFPEPTIRFYGDNSEGFRAVAIAIQHQLPVRSIRRAWTVIENEPTGPNWEMTFRTAPPPPVTKPTAAVQPQATAEEEREA